MHSLLILFFVIAPCHSSRILAMFPIPSISHQVVFRPLTQELAKRGHHIIVLTTDPVFENAKAPENFTEVNLHEDSYAVWNKDFVEQVNGQSYDSYSMLELIFRTIFKIFFRQWNSKVVQDAVRGKEFDLLLIEANVRPALVLSHLYKNTPVIQISSLATGGENYVNMGSLTHPVLYPEFTRKRIHHLSWTEKIQGIYDELQFRYLQWKLVEYEDNLVRQIFGEGIPSVSEMATNIDLLLLNVHPIWDNNRPVPPGIVYMGGMHQKPVKDLTKDLQSYLDNSRHGVIYMSFGTNVDTRILSRDKIEIFTKVFKRLPYDVLWKWNDDTLEGKPDNVNISKWLPQSDLLRHPKVKVFITQAGLQSTDEAITAGVPLIAFPMLGDQWYNAEQYVKHKIGLKLNFEELTEEALERSIKTIIADKSYRANIQRLRLIMKDQPQPPLERAIWWIEYVLRHGGAKHLRAPSVGVGWIEYLMLDVVGFLVVSFVIIIFIIRNFVRFLFMSSTKKVKGH